MKKKFFKFFELLLVVFLTGTIAACNKNPDNGGNEETKDDCITIAEAIEIAKTAGDAGTEEEYKVRATVEKVIKPEFGEMTIKDSTGTIYVYGIEGYQDMKDKPYARDEVLIQGKLQMFNDQPEFKKSKLIEFTHAPEEEIDESKYEEVSIATARNKVAGTKVKLTGVVANITYTQKRVANGFYLVDNSNSIYVYSHDAVQKVKVGNTVTILAERENYISSKETKHAEKFGYQGCIQVKDVHLKANDDKVSTFNKTWIEEKTIKELMETPLTNNITTSISKVTGFIRKDKQEGYTNYYINDLDRKTGSYVYTSNSGADFTWLDEFDGKLCDIYLSIINAKSTESGCIYRLMPIEVKLSDFVLEDSKVPSYIMEYHALGQFDQLYNADPAQEVITAMSDDVLKFQDAKVTYTSSNTNVIDFTQEKDKLVMHTKAEGSSEVTITVTYKTYTLSKTITITKEKVDVSDAINVKEAISKKDDTKVKVKGVVISKVANKSGVYIADETGVIAILGNKEEIKELSIGDLVYVEGTRAHNRKASSVEKNIAGESCIADAKIILNEFGNHEIPTASFNTETTIEQLLELKVSEDYTAQVYTLKGKLLIEKKGYSTNYYVVSLTNPEKKIQLYKGSTSQYSWLDEFQNEEEITFNFALCNWNDKTYYAGCVLSASNGTKTLHNDVDLKK